MSDAFANGYATPDREKGGTVRAAYVQLMEGRESFLDRARDCSLLTMPYLIPEEDHGPDDEFVTPYQADGARSVNNLAGKLLDALFPPGQSFFRLDIDPFLAEELLSEADASREAQPEGADGPPDEEIILNQINQTILQVRRTIILEIDHAGIRAKAFEAFRHLIVAGNALFYQPEDEEPQVYPLSQFVVERAGNGDLLTIILQEKVNINSLPSVIRDALPVDDLSDEEKSGRKDLDIYTAIYRDEDGDFVEFQEVSGVWFDSEGDVHTSIDTMDTVAAADLPWLPLVWHRAAGEDYGRGHAEDYIGSLTTLEAVAEALSHAGINAAKLVCFVNPMGVTNQRTVQRARNGDVLPGRLEDVEFLQVGKGADMKFVLELHLRTQQLINRAFLVGDGTQRDKERVTAEEIRMLIRELQHALGGIFGMLSLSMQYPIIRSVIRRLESQERIPEINEKVLKLRVVTGFEALGQDQDLERLRGFLGSVAETIGPQAFELYFDPRPLILELANAAGVEVKDFLRSKEAVEGLRQQQMQMALAEKAAGPVAGAAAGALTNQPGNTQ